MTPYRLFALWIAVTVVALLAALVLFAGVKESEVAGNLTFTMLVLGFPTSIGAYPLALELSAPYEAQGLYPYNSRALLALWWAAYFVLGLLQWGFIAWWATRRNLPRRSRSGPAANGRPLS